MRISDWISDVCSSDLEQVYDRADNYSFGEFHNNIESIVEGVQGNNDVTWQTERKADIGIDFSLFQGRFSGSVDYFDNFRYDILTKRSTIPSYFGVQASNLPPRSAERREGKECI